MDTTSVEILGMKSAMPTKSEVAHMHRRATVPARVNIIGEHTDYAGGLSLPFAIGKTLVLDAIGQKWGHQFHYETDMVGGCAIDAFGTPLRDETVERAKLNDAVLFVAVGGPKWDNEAVRPEAAILGIRKALGLFANIRPVRVFPGMEGAHFVARADGEQERGARHGR